MQVNFSINIDDKLVERVKRFFTKRNTTVIVLIFTVAAATVILNGEVITKRWHFNNGDIIDAGRINDNFDELFAKVNKLDALGGEGLVPRGTIAAYLGTTDPSGWLICDGRTIDVNATTNIYLIELWNILPPKYATTGKIILPDLRGRVIVGVDLADTHFHEVGNTYGAKERMLAPENMPSHSHSLPKIFDLGEGGSGDALKFLSDSGGDYYVAYKQEGILSTLSTGENAPFEIIQPSISMNYIIKY